jgi:RNase P/RNase MRP subunit POP5
MRQKYRFLICQVLNGPVGGPYGVTNAVSTRDVHTKIIESVTELYGSVGASKMTNLKVIYFDVNEDGTSLLCIRCNRDFHKEIQFALSCIQSFRSSVAIVRCLRIAGSLRTALLALWATLTTHIDSHKNLDSSTAMQLKRKYLIELKRIA